MRSTMFFLIIGSLSLLAFVFCSQGCKLEIPAFEVEVSEASGGAGGEASVSSSSSVGGSGGGSVSSSSSSSGVGGSGGVPAPSCQDDLNSLSCFDGGFQGVNCIACATQGDCADENAACTADPACGAYKNCLSSCVNGGSSWQDCEDSCDALHAGDGGEALYVAIFNCVYCTNCDLACAAVVASNPAVPVWDLACVP